MPMRERRGADLRAWTDKGEGALMLGAENGSCAICQALMEPGFDPRRRDDSGRQFKAWGQPGP